MIRRDYIIRMIEEFIQALARIRALRSEGREAGAAEALDEEFQRLTGSGASTVARLSDVELEALLLRGEPTQLIRQKTFILTALLKEAGDLALARDAGEEARVCYLRALHLLLKVMGDNDGFEAPEFVPRIEVILGALSHEPLPAETAARLMLHFERMGEYGRAEDVLFDMIEAEPARPGLAQFGIAFYERVARHSDRALENGNLPRAELEAGLA